MLDAELVSPQNAERAAELFHLDGFVLIEDALTPDQLSFARTGADRVVSEQTSSIPLEDANRGYARYSFGPQLHHPEWSQLIDLPTILPVLEAIWESPAFYCWGGGGDYFLPGAEIQKLHADMADSLRDPQQRVTVMDLPTPIIVVNFPMVDFEQVNGGTRFVRGTHRYRHPIPSLEEEPDWMKTSIACVPAGTGIVRDIRCWHGGTANRSDEVRVMTSVGYAAPWYHVGRPENDLPQAVYGNLISGRTAVDTLHRRGMRLG